MAGVEPDRSSGGSRWGFDGGWLVRDGDVLASVEIARGWRARAQGLLGRTGIEGAIVLPGARSVHSFGMRFELDVAFCDRDDVVIRTLRLHPHRVTLPVLRSRWVVEAEAGSFGTWELKIGDRIDVRAASEGLAGG